MLTKQQIFNKVYLGLAGQGFERSVKAGEYGQACVYRASGGKRCAVGHLIPDWIYGEWVEDFGTLGSAQRILYEDSSTSIKRRALISACNVPLYEEHVEFLVELQRAHDGFDSYVPNPEEMQAELISIAEHNDLTVPEIAEER